MKIPTNYVQIFSFMGIAATIISAATMSRHQVPSALKSMVNCQLVQFGKLKALGSKVPDSVMLEIYTVKKSTKKSNDFRFVTLFRDRAGNILVGDKVKEADFQKLSSNYVHYLKERKIAMQDVPHGYQLKLAKDDILVKCLYLCFDSVSLTTYYKWADCATNRMMALSDSSPGRCPPCARQLAKQQVVNTAIYSQYEQNQ